MKKETIIRNENNKLVKITRIKRNVIVKDDEGKEFKLGLLDEKGIALKSDRNFYKLWTPKYNLKKINKSDLNILLWFKFIDKMNLDNKLIIECTDLSKMYNTTRQTIMNTIKRLIKMNLLKYKNKIIFVNPMVVYKGKAEFRTSLIEDYGKNIFFNGR